VRIYEKENYSNFSFIIFFFGCYSPVSEIIPLDDIVKVKAGTSKGSETASETGSSSSDDSSTGDDESSEEEIAFEVTYKMGTITSYPNIYAVWIENQGEGFIQNISICNRLINPKGQTGYALPYWKLNKYPSSDSSELDAVTGATKANQDFTTSAVLRDNSIRQFTLYVEVERSYDANNWFTDQPAVLFSADIDLDSAATEYELTPCGWTPSAKTEGIISGTLRGVLQDELRYITNLKDGSGFGDIDADNKATNMVKSITVEITR